MTLGSRALDPRVLRLGMNIWPPYLFAGIRVEAIGVDWSSARVRLKLARTNRNYVGTQFGGSLFSMTDPFWMLLLMHQLGPGYLVWDRRAEIEFVRPGRSTVTAEFVLSPDRVEEARTLTAGGDKALLWFDTDVRDSDGELVARVRKQVYVRRKPPRTDPDVVEAAATTTAAHGRAEPA